MSTLDKLYEGRTIYRGDLHVHTACGGTSDGSQPMAEWPAKMDALGVDFAAVVDHRHIRPSTEGDPRRAPGGISAYS